MNLYGLVGAGGFGREVMPLVEALLKNNKQQADHQIFFLQEEQPTKAVINNYPVITMEEFFSQPATAKYFNIAIANAAVRERIAKKMLARGIQPFHITANNSLELGPNRIGEGAIFCPFTTVTSNATIGKFFHANIYSYVAHDCIIGDYVTFAPHVHCNGNVIIEDFAYIGTGAVIREGTPERPMIIGKGAVIGMGAVVTKSVPPHETVVGNPARPLNNKITQPLIAQTP